MNLTVLNPGSLVSPGVHLLCYGPYAAPRDARALVRFQPDVNMALVHHLIMFASPGAPTSSRASCGGNIIYAWARTGQTTPQGLELSSAATGTAGLAYGVGPGSDIGHFSLQLHYQNMEGKPVFDKSGVRLSFESRPPKTRLRFDVLMSTRVNIPPAVFIDECVACRVTRGGTVFGFRNHAHRLARDIWTDEFDAHGAAKPSIGRLSAQEPQIIRLLPKPRSLAEGESLELHCLYNASGVDRPTRIGLDERSKEMCNQYYLSTSALRVECDGEVAAPSPPANAALNAAVAKYREASEGSPLGQVTGAAADGEWLYFFHRGKANFMNTQPLDFAPILRFSRKHASLGGAIGRGLFTVPHGLSLDPAGFLWATDVGSHQVFKLNAQTGAVLLKLGDGRAAAGPSSFNKPTDVAVERGSGEVYVADGYGNSRIAVFSSSGEYLREWGSAGSQPGQFRVPHGIVIDSRGLVYVADRENSRVQVFTQAGALVTVWASRVGADKGFGSNLVWRAHVSSVSYDPSLDLFAVTEGSNVILRSASGCTLLSRGPFLWPHDAILLPPLGPATPPALAGSWRANAGRPFSFAVAELEGKRVTQYEVRLGSGRAGLQSMYG